MAARQRFISSPPARPDPTPGYTGAKRIQEQFSADVLRALRTLGKIFAWMGYGTIVGGLIMAMAFEGGHVWVEQQMKVKPDDDAKRWGWEPESWTGGEYGGTSAKLGLFGRHAVRAAWFALNFRTPFLNAALSGENGKYGALAFTDQDLHSAGIYLERAIARMRDQEGKLPPDREVLDLLERYASVQELLASPAALVRAYRSYLQVHDGKASQRMKQAQLAVKLGNISERLGDEDSAMTWWSQAIALIKSDTEENLERSTPRDSIGTAESPFSSKIDGIEPKTHGAHGEHSQTETFNSAPFRLILPVQPPSSPLAQRTLVSALLALSAFFSRRGYFEEAKYVEEKSFALIDRMVSPSDHSQIGQRQTPGEVLHNMYLMHRKAVLTVHHAEVTYALEKVSGKPDAANSLTDLLTAASLSEVVSQVLTGKTSVHVVTRSVTTPVALAARANLLGSYGNSKLLRPSAERVLRDARLTVAEAWDLAGVLYQGRDDAKAAECFERALGWTGIERAEDVSMTGWEALWKRFVEAKERVGRTDKGKSS